MIQASPTYIAVFSLNTIINLTKNIQKWLEYKTLKPLFTTIVYYEDT